MHLVVDANAAFKNDGWTLRLIPGADRVRTFETSGLTGELAFVDATTLR